MTQFGLVVRFALKPGRAEEFDAVMRDTVAGIAANERRTLAYAVHELDGEPDVRIFYELYSDEDALAEHESQTTTRAFLDRVDDFVTSAEGSACISSRRPASTASLPTQGEDLGAVVGDRDRVLAVGRAAAGGAAQRPAVVVGDQLVGVGHDPRLEREQQSGAQPVAAAGAPSLETCGSWCIVDPMPWPPNSVLIG